MPSFTPKFYENNLPSLVELREVCTRLTAEIAASNADVFSDTFVNAEGLLLDNFDWENTRAVITVNVDRSKNADLIKYKDSTTKVYPTIVDIAIETARNDIGQRTIDAMVEYIHRSLCFNDCVYEVDLTPTEGFSNSSYMINLVRNKLMFAASENNSTLKTQLTFLISLEKQ